MRTFLLIALLVAAAAAGSVLHPAQQAGEGWSLDTETPVDMKSSVRITIGLKRRNMDVLNKILMEVSTPSSPKYGEHLTQDQMTDLIAPAKENVDRVLSWLSKFGVTPKRVDVNQDYVRVEETLETIANIFGVKFEMFKFAKGGRKVARALEAVVVPAEIADVVELITGMQGFPLITNGPVKMKRGDGEKLGLAAGMPNVDPANIRQAYAINTTANTGKKNIQAIAEFQGQFVSNTDLSSFCQQYDNGASCKVTKFVHTNTPGQPGIESSLDIEYIMSIAKGVDTWVYSYPNMDFCGDLLSWGSDVLGESGEHPWVVSMSYGSQKIDFCPSTTQKRLSEDIQKMGAQGVTSIIASGDSGSGQYSREGYNGGKLSPSFPAEIPYCMSVGSTTYIAGSSGEQQATTQFGSGGGLGWDFTGLEFSKSAVDAYFTEAKLPSAKYNRQGRPTPDVSLLGEGFHVINGGQNIQVGGTSASTPTWSGVVSLLNNVRLSAGKSTFGFILPFIYGLPQSCFNDITVGSNAVGQNQIGWQCAKGWDPVTGRGTPNFPCLSSHAGSATPPPPGPTPPPTPPTPTPPPTPPTPPQPSGDFTQKQCTDSACTQGCQSHSFPQNACLKDQSGGSVKAHCTSAGLVEDIYLFSATCTGFHESSTSPVNQCFPTQGGQYAENICPTTATKFEGATREGYAKMRKL